MVTHPILLIEKLYRLQLISYTPVTMCKPDSIFLSGWKLMRPRRKTSYYLYYLLSGSVLKPWMTCYSLYSNPFLGIVLEHLLQQVTEEFHFHFLQPRPNSLDHGPFLSSRWIVLLTNFPQLLSDELLLSGDFGWPFSSNHRWRCLKAFHQ